MIQWKDEVSFEPSLNISGPADKKIRWGSKLLVHNWQPTLIRNVATSIMLKILLLTKIVLADPEADLEYLKGGIYPVSGPVVSV